MRDSQVDRIQSVFLAALEEPSDTRMEWLKKECTSDPDLYSEVVKLLAHDLGTNDPLEQPLAKALGDLPTSSNFELLSATEFQSKRITRSENVRRKPIPEELRKFEDYELLEEIARGGMGVVYKAKQVSLGRIVALKMIVAGQFADTQEIDRFRAEAEAAANLDHPGIVPIFEIGTHQGQHFFSMAYVEGESLSQQLSHGPLEPRAAAELLLQIANAISYAHSKGVIHRDLKPANVLLDYDSGKARVTDFGLAKRYEADANLTKTGQIIGTPAYMSPEQASGRHSTVDELSDIYSLGGVLFALLTGNPPFKGASATDVILQVLNIEPTPPRQLNSRVDKDLNTICLKCMNKEKRARYASTDELILDLKAYLSDMPIKARPLGKLRRTIRWCKRNKMQSFWIGAFALSLFYPLVLGLIGIVAVFMETLRSPLKLGDFETANIVYMDTITESGEIIQSPVTVANGIYVKRMADIESEIQFAFERPIVLHFISGRVDNANFSTGGRLKVWTELTCAGEKSELLDQVFDLKSSVTQEKTKVGTYTLLCETRNDDGEEIWHWNWGVDIFETVREQSQVSSLTLSSPIAAVTRTAKNDSKSTTRTIAGGAVKNYLQQVWPPRDDEKWRANKAAEEVVVRQMQESTKSDLGKVTSSDEEHVLVQYMYRLGTPLLTDFDQNYDVILQVKCKLLEDAEIDIRSN